MGLAISFNGKPSRYRARAYAAEASAGLLYRIQRGCTMSIQMNPYSSRPRPLISRPQGRPDSRTVRCIREKKDWSHKPIGGASCKPCGLSGDDGLWPHRTM